MTAFRELRDADLRRINGLTRKMAGSGDWDQLAVICVREIPRCVPIDYVAWNVFNRERTEICAIVATPQVQDRANELLDEVNAYLYRWHPVLSTVGWKGVERRLRTMSDFQSCGRFRQSPLYREAYRHLEADYQAAESVGYYGNRNLTMSYNRRLRDFSRREREILHMINRRIDVVAREVHRRHIMRRNLARLTALAGAGTLPADDLTAAEIHGMASIVRGEPAARDTRTRLQAKLGLESSKQVASLVVDAIRSGADFAAKGAPCEMGF